MPGGIKRLNDNLQSLLLIFNQALDCPIGVKVRVKSLGDAGRTASSFKALFYKARKYSPAYSGLILVSTANPEIFMIIKEDISNGQGVATCEPQAES